MFYFSRFSFVVIPDLITFPVAEWTGETLRAAVHTFSALRCFLFSFFVCFLHPVDILFPHIFFLAFSFSRPHWPRWGQEKAMQRCTAWCFWSANAGRQKSSEIVCVCVCVCVYYAWNEECSHAHMYRRDREWQPSTDVLPPKNGLQVFSDGFMYC